LALQETWENVMPRYWELAKRVLQASASLENPSQILRGVPLRMTAFEGLLQRPADCPCDDGKTLDFGWLAGGKFDWPAVEHFKSLVVE
jgi:hypothetical protein